MRGRRMAAAALPVLLAAAVILGGAAARRAVAAMEFDRPRSRDRVVVIDAGHGGEDGGAGSLTGVPESQLNLAVALRVDALLGLYGEQVVMLREEDVSLHSPQAETLREKKSSDLRNRAAAVEAVEGAVLLSIHQNSYPDSRYRGAQVFYAPTQGSEALARYAQQLLRRTLDPDNDRQAKKIPETASMMLVTMDATQFTMLSKIQLRSNPAHLPGAGRHNMGLIRCTYRLESRAASMLPRNQGY